MDANTQIPSEYIEHLSAQLPPHISIDDVINACRQPLRLSARVNTAKIAITECLSLWESLGWKAEPIAWCGQGFWLTPIHGEDSISLGNTFAHAQGLFYLQEASSMLPAMAFTHSSENAATLSILDMAAAPGSKTTQLANLFSDSHIIANELSASRLKSLHHNLLRCGAANHTLTNFNAKVFGEYQAESYDKILLDAPCSGEGTVRRDPDALKTWSKSLSQELAELQLDLLTSAFHALKVGGELVYSTCTLSCEENQGVLSKFLEAFGEYVRIDNLKGLFEGAKTSVTPEGYLHIFPNLYDTGGFFVAKLTKQKCAPLPSTKKAKKRKSVFSALSSQQTKALAQYFQQQFEFDCTHLLANCYERDNEIWWLPSTGQHVAQQIHISRSGIKVVETHKKGFRLHHEFVNCFADMLTRSRIDLSKTEATLYLQGQDIHIEETERLSALPKTGDVVAFYQGFALGCVKRINSRLKNALPRDKVRDKPYQ